MNCNENNCRFHYICDSKHANHSNPFICPCTTCLKNPVCRDACIDYCYFVSESFKLSEKNFFNKSENMIKERLLELY